MATERIRTIKPAGQGGDYTSIAAWEAAEQADLVSLDEVRIGEIDGYWTTPDTTRVEIDGWTADSTRYIEVRAVGSARHNGKWDNTKYRLEYDSAGLNFFVLLLNEAYVRINNIQIYSKQSASPSFHGCLSVGPNSNDCIINNVIAQCDPSGGSYIIGFELSNNTILTNCIALNAIGGSGVTHRRGFHCQVNSASITIYYYNCIAYNCSAGFSRTNANISIVKNCLAQNCTDGFYGTFDVASTNNCSDITSDAPGSNPKTGTVLFTDAANGDFSLSPYDTIALGQGTNLYADATYPVTTDIRGISRGSSSAAYFDIGAFHSTTKIRTIKPTGQGGNYTSLATWETGEQTDLTAVNKISIGEIDGYWSSPDTTNVAIDGWITDSTRYIEIRAINVARHTGKWSNSNSYRLVIQDDTSGAIRVNEDYVRLDGLQIQTTNPTSNGRAAIEIRVIAGELRVIKCIIRGTADATYWQWIINHGQSTSTGNILIENCIIYDIALNGGASAFRQHTLVSGTTRIYNTTIFGSGTGVGIEGSSSNIIAINCICNGLSDGFNGTFHSSSMNNCSDIASDAPGTNPITGTVLFSNSANGDFTLSPYDTVAQFAGANLWNDTYPVTTDIAGNSRGGPSASFDVGASHALVSIRTIKPTGQGGNYTSLSAWESGQQRDLVANNKIAVGEIDGDWSGGPDTTSLTIDGSNTDSSHYIEIRVIGTAKHLGKWDTTKYLHRSSSNNITITDPYVRLIGIQAQRDSAPVATARVFRILEGPCYINNCIVKGPDVYDTTSELTAFAVEAPAIVIIVNCIAWNMLNDANSRGLGFVGNNGTAFSYFYNCTAHECYRGYYRQSGTSFVKNSIAQSSIAGFSGSFDTSSTNNCSDIGDAQGSNPVNATANFIDAANGDFHLTSNNPLILRAGKDLSGDQYGFNTDIDGEYRILYWDIGADQYVNPHKIKFRGDKISVRKLKVV